MKSVLIKLLLGIAAAIAAIILFFVIGHLVKGNIFTKFLFSDHVKTVVVGNVEFVEFIDKPGKRFLQYDDNYEIRIWYKFQDERDYKILHSSYYYNRWIRPSFDEVSCIETLERNGLSYMAATPSLAAIIDSTQKSPPPAMAVYVINPQEKRFPLFIEVGFDTYGEIIENFYGNCKLPRIDKRVHSVCSISTNFFYWPNRKKEREKLKKDLIAYEKQMMTDSTFVSGLYEAFDSFNLNKDCLDSLVQVYEKNEED